MNQINDYNLKTFRGGVRDEKGRIVGNGTTLIEKKEQPITIIPYHPHIHQLHIHQHLDSKKTKYNTLVCCRRFGKSKLSISQSIKWCLSEEKQLVAYITHSLRLCRKFFTEIDELFTGELRDIVIKDVNKTELIIKFKNGSVLQFFSFENSNKIRGFGFNYAVLDEAQEVETEDFYATIFPTMANRICKQVLILGTPNTTDSWFYDWFERGMSEEPEHKNYKSFRYTIWDIPDFLMDVSEKKDMEQFYPKDIFKMEWLAEFVDGLISVFKGYLECVFDKEEIPYDAKYEYVMGVDTGRSDYTVASVIRSDGQLVYQLRVNNIDYHPMADMVIHLIKKYHIRKTLIEINSIGDAFLSILKQKSKDQHITRHEWIEIFTNNENKRDYIEELIVAFQNQTIKILNLKELKKELGKFILEFSPRTRARVYKGIGNSHDDTVISLALAWKCFKEYKGKLDRSYAMIINR